MGQILGPFSVWVDGWGGGGGTGTLELLSLHLPNAVCFCFFPAQQAHTIIFAFSASGKLVAYCFLSLQTAIFPGSWHILVVCNCFLHYSVEVILHMNTYFHICYSVERILIWTHIINILYMFIKTEFLCFLFCTSWNLCPCFLRSASCVASQCLQQCNVCM